MHPRIDGGNAYAGHSHTQVGHRHAHVGHKHVVHGYAHVVPYAQITPMLIGHSHTPVGHRHAHVGHKHVVHGYIHVVRSCCYSKDVNVWQLFLAQITPHTRGSLYGIYA